MMAYDLMEDVLIKKKTKWRMLPQIKLSSK